MKLVFVNPANRGYKNLYITLSWRFFFFVVTLNLFAFIYQILEQPENVKNKEGNKERSEMIQGNNLLRNFTSFRNVNLSELENFLSSLDCAGRKAHYGNNSKQMTYLEALIVTMSVFYSIGLGRMEPQTTEGKIHLIACACVGIPMTFLMIVSAAKILIRQMQDIILCLYCSDEKKYNKGIVNKQILPSLILVLVIFLQVSTGLVMIFEKVSYIDALHYSIFTLTTVGSERLMQTILLSEGDLLRTVGLPLFLFFWILFGVVLVAANLLMIFSAKLESRDIVSIRYIKGIRTEGEDICIDTELEGTQMKTFSIVQYPDEDLKSNLRHLFS